MAWLDSMNRLLSQLKLISIVIGDETIPMNSTHSKKHRRNSSDEIELLYPIPVVLTLEIELLHPNPMVVTLRQLTQHFSTSWGSSSGAELSFCPWWWVDSNLHRMSCRLLAQSSWPTCRLAIEGKTGKNQDYNLTGLEIITASKEINSH